MPKHKSWFWLAALAAAVLFDFLFWKKPFGLSFAIWTFAVLLGGWLLSWREEKKPVFFSYVLSILILGFAFVPAWRGEPFTRAFSFFMTLTGLLLLAATFLNGYWPLYRMRDYLWEMMKALGGALSRAFTMGSGGQNPPPLEQPQRKSFWKKILPVFRGVLIAVPIVAVLAGLLSSADPVFGDWIKRILDLQNLPEYIFRFFYILMITLLLVGVYLHAILPRDVVERPNPQQAWMKPFMGWTETSIILGAVDILFISFVIVQMRYLFGGSANINETGYTFSEYARRGFGELVAVAVLSLLLYLCLNTITKRETGASRIGFSIFSILLMANVLAILASSLQRLLLYENAYGFSRLRTYTHVCIYWLGALIVVTILFELIKKRGHFALALVISLIGFGATLAIMNVDGFITQKNITRANNGESLDVQYINSLSDDIVPTVILNMKDPMTTKEVNEGLGYALACRQKAMLESEAKPWQGFNLGEARAAWLLEENSELWSKLKLFNSNDRGWYYMLYGEEFSCSEIEWMD